MYKTLVLFLALSSSALPFSAHSKDAEIMELLDGKLEITISTKLKQLSSAAINKRFSGSKVKPLVVYSDIDAQAAISLQQYNTPANKSSMKKIQKALSTMFKQVNPDAKWKKDKLNSRFGTKVGIYEFENKGLGKYEYQIVYAFPVEGKLTLVTFITTDKKHKASWVSLAKESFDSIDVY